MKPNDANEFIKQLLEDPLTTKAAWLTLDPEDRKRLRGMLFDVAELGQIRNLGTIEVTVQEFDPDYQGKVSHSPATLKMDKRGRDRLIAALIEGCDQIDVYDKNGEGYPLLLVLEYVR